MADYPTGETVTVYYDPENPSGANLIRSRNLLMPLLTVERGGPVTVGALAAPVNRILGFAT